jgi:hypothetical protein
MKTTDIFNSLKSKKLNETVQRTFGQSLDLESFDLEKLQDVRNRLRTHLHQVKTSSGFNETVENESFLKAQWMLDTVNAEIVEREAQQGTDTVQEAFSSDTEMELNRIAKSEDFDMLYDAVGGLHGGEIADVLNDMIDDISSETRLHPDDDAEKIHEILMDRLVDEYGEGDFDSNKEDVSYEDYDKDEYDEEGEMVKTQLRTIDDASQELTSILDDDDNLPEWVQLKITKAMDYLDTARDYMKSTDDTEKEPDMNMPMKESATDKASAVVTAKTMVDRVGRWIEELAGMENDTLLTLGDTIRDEMGQEQAKAFLSAVAPAIQQALENLKQTRETLASGVRSLTGEAQPAELIGTEPEAAPMDTATPATPDAMNAEPEVEPEDEFAAAEPAAGGPEEAGRAKRESIEYSNKLLKVLAG